MSSELAAETNDVRSTSISFTLLALCACVGGGGTKVGTAVSRRERTEDELVRVAVDAVERAGIRSATYDFSAKDSHAKWHDVLLDDWNRVRENEDAITIVADGSYDVVWVRAKQSVPYASNLFDELVVLVDRAAEERCAVIDFRFREFDPPMRK